MVEVVVGVEGGYSVNLWLIFPAQADVFYGRGQEVLDQRALIKSNTLAMRRKMHYENKLVYKTR